MIVTNDEAVALGQLADRDHRLSWVRHGLQVRLDVVPENQWALDQVADWRARHDPYCACWAKANPRA
jgi:hypothetical protein